jgi:hypothetical protein
MVTGFRQGVEFAGKTERLEVSGKAALDFVDYYGGEPNRFTNVFLPLTMKYRTERDEWGFTGGFTRDNTLMGELLTTGSFYDSPNETCGILNPTWTRMITEKFGFQEHISVQRCELSRRPPSWAGRLSSVRWNSRVPISRDGT